MPYQNKINKKNNSKILLSLQNPQNLKYIEGQNNNTVFDYAENDLQVHQAKFNPYEDLDTNLLGFDPNAIFEGISYEGVNFAAY